MINISGFDDYSQEGILNLIQTMAQVYTPEWKMNHLEPDGGYALAVLFSGMFSETLNIFNSVPHKHYLFFLNMLGVNLNNGTPSKGFVNFDVHKNTNQPVTIKKNTKLFSISEDIEGTNKTVIFETDRNIQAISSSIISVFNVSSKKDIIEKFEHYNGGCEFFNAKKENNLQLRKLTICNDNVLNLKNPSEIILRFTDNLAHNNTEFLPERLTDKDLAHWFYFDANGVKREFSDVRNNKGIITLTKNDIHELSKIPVKGFKNMEQERHAIVCELTKGNDNFEVSINDIQIRSSCISDEYYQGILPDYIYYNDIAVSIKEPDYCYGKNPVLFDSFYISSDEAFTKAGAEVNLEFKIKTIVKEVGDIPTGPVYDFYHKYIVEKTDYTKIEPDEIYISKVHWEYWNGVGWTRLEVKGGNNVFVPSENIYKRNITFTCPKDFVMSYQNSLYGYWIRARILEIENLYSRYGKWNLPFCESLEIKYNYAENIPSYQLLNVENNLNLAVYGEESQGIRKTIISPLSYEAEAVYFAFDSPPKGYPFTIYFEIRGRTNQNRVIIAQSLLKGIDGEPVWKELRINDMTNGLEESGVIEFFIGEDLIRSSLYGQDAFWIRIYDGNMKFNNNSEIFPVVENIILNAVTIVQRNSFDDERHKISETIEGAKYIIIRNTPIISCEVWIDEISNINSSEIKTFIDNCPSDIKKDYSPEGKLIRLWVKWKENSGLTESIGLREFALDRTTGHVNFGFNNDVLESGKTDVSVKYSYGGGVIGNINKDEINGLLVSLPGIDKVSNFTGTFGGSDRGDVSILEKIGNSRILHRGRAVTISDFENLAMENFREITDAKCFSGYDDQAREQPGAVTLVVSSEANSNSYKFALCNRIKSYFNNLIISTLKSKSLFFVTPAIDLEILVTLSVVPINYENAAELEKRLTSLINMVIGQKKDISGGVIGQMPSKIELLSVIKKTENVAAIQDLTLEGRYIVENRVKIIALDDSLAPIYAIARCGDHKIKFLS